MAQTPLVRLLEDADLASILLALLPMRALAALQCTCKAARSAMAGQEPLWQVRPATLLTQPAAAAASLSCCLVAQAAAQREHVAHHPVLEAPSVQTYLRRHLDALANLRAGLVTSPPLVDARGAVGPDLATQALLGPGPSVQLCSLETGQLLRQWALPDVPSPCCPEHTWGWPAGSHVVLLFGGRWLVPGDEIARGSVLSGLVFLNTDTGCVDVWQLPVQGPQDYIWALIHSCPGKGLVFVQHGSGGGQDVYSVFTSQGALVGRTMHTTLHLARHDCWAPGQGGVLVFTDASKIVFMCTDIPLQQVHTGGQCYIAWGHPFCATMLALSQDDTVTLVNVGGPAQVSLHELSGVGEFGWGVRLLCFGCTSELQKRSLQGLSI